MNKLSFSDKEYQYPESMLELTFGEWEELEKIKEEFIGDTQSFAMKLDLLERITGIDKNFLWSEAPRQVFYAVYNSCKWFFDFDPKSITPAPFFMIDGVKFVYTEDPNIPMSMWVDRDAVLEHYPQEKKYSAMLAIFVRPEGEKYDYEKLEERIALIKKQPAESLVPLISFFFLKEELLRTNFQVYSMQMQMAMGNHFRLQNFLESGDGTKSLFNWRTKISRKLMPYLSEELLKSSTFYHTCQTMLQQQKII